ncbi:MAG TPA: symmetrical bis(5'-nucleosyl)-tetraphosphatase [Burkholderiaceae bacterium]|nr:symmetrical bis(5'-nucleosyl)-tetraphosphatase [Burkholderiaceae bacterium]
MISCRRQAPDACAIGDPQGCLDSLQALVGRLERSAADAGMAAPRLWLTGDLVNRGPRSLATLRWAIGQGERVVTVLGNHDLHLLAVAAGARPAHRRDTLHDVLAAPDRDALIEWLRQRPIAHLEQGHLLVHAGVLPQWSAERTMKLAAEVEAVLRGPDWADFLRQMYGDEPSRWHDDLRGVDRLRVIVNALTRLRFLRADGSIDLRLKEGANAAPAGHLPWFDAPDRRSADVTVVFGHWSTLGLLLRPNLIGLDTGCVWGGALTAVRLSDRAVTQVPCPRAQDPGGD